MNPERTSESGALPVVDETLLVEVVESVVQRKLEPVQARLDALLARLDGEAVEAEALLTAHDLAELLKCDRRTVRRLELSGEVPPGLRIGGSKRWRAGEVRRWLDALRAATPGGGRL